MVDVNKQLAFLSIVAILAAGLILGGGTARAATCSVPTGSYPMIQDAVNDGSCSTINVAPGTYFESVTIGRPLTLVGPNAGVSWSSVRNPEAIVSSGATTFNLTDGTGVTIDGFTIDGDFGVYVSSSSTNTLIQNDIISGITRAVTLDAPGSNPSILNSDMFSNVRSLHVSGGLY